METEEYSETPTKRKVTHRKEDQIACFNPNESPHAIPINNRNQHMQYAKNKKESNIKRSKTIQARKAPEMQ